ncbi:hypothetical protein Dimus_008585 [Dionaea muscipula]
MKRTKVTEPPECSSRCAASSQQTQEEEITDFDPLDHPSLTLARLWPKFEYYPIVCGRSFMLDAQYHYFLNDFVNSMGWGSLLNLPDRFYLSVVRHFYCNLTWTDGRHRIELHSYFLGHRLKITRPLLACWIGVDLCDNKTYFVRGREFMELSALTHPLFYTEIVVAVCHTRDTPGIKLDLPTIIMNEIVRIKEADGSKALGFGALLTRVFENTPILLEEELNEVCGGPLNQFVISQSKVLEKINARAAQVDVNPDDVNEVVDELMDDAGGNVNAPRRAYSSSMTPQVFAEYHREIMEGIQALQTLGHAHTNQLRSIATTQNLHERRISGLERDLSNIRDTTDRIERHLLGLPHSRSPFPSSPSCPSWTGPWFRK